MRTYGELHLDEAQSNWIVRQLEPHVAIRLKQIFPRLPKASTGPYSFPYDLTHSADLAWFVQRYPLDADKSSLDALQVAANGFRDRIAEMERILQPSYTPSLYSGLHEGMSLREYQSQAVDLLSHRKTLLVGDVVGLGKTYTACGAMLINDALPAIIVCQPHLQTQWHQVVEGFTTLRAHSVTKTKPYSLPAADVFVFRYSQLPGWVDYFQQFSPGLVGWDEIQELRRGTDAQKGVASLHLARQARYRLGLSATPIYNYGAEIFNVMRFVEDGLLGTREEFMREWTDGKLLKDPRALGTFLREHHVFIRRTRKDVGRELPPVNKVVEIVDYDNQEVQSAEELARQL